MRPDTTPRSHPPRRRAATGPSPRLAALTATFAAALLVMFPMAWATTYLEQTPEEMVLAADMIFVGNVIDVATTNDAGTAWTEVTFDVERWLADRRLEDGADEDEAEPARVTLRFLGGTLPGGERLTVSGLPNYELGQRVLIFAYDAPEAASPVVGVRQGSWTLGVTGARGEEGSFLTVPTPGRLQRGATGSGLEELVGAITALREAGTLPSGTPAPPTDEEEAERDEAETQADEPDAEADEAEEPATDGAEAGTGESETQTDEQEEPATEGADGAPEGEAGNEGAESATDQADGEPGYEGAPDAPTSDEGRPEAPVEPTPASPLPPAVVSYTVDESGGPLLLSTAVNRAAAAWEAAAPASVEFEPLPAGAAGQEAHRVAYGDAVLFGPDALSLTLGRGDSRTTEVLVNPTVGSLLEPVLLHELGVLIGLPEGGVGVMAHAVVAGTLEPTEADLAALAALRTYRPEDLNQDGVVDFYDLVEFSRQYGRSGVNLAADLNGDGTVDEADLAQLEEAYEFLPPSERPPGPR